MTQVKIMPKGFDGEVRQVVITGNQVTFSEQDLPCEFVLHKSVSEPSTSNVVLTTVVKVSNQTGQHRLTTSNGFSHTGSFDDISLALTSSPQYGITMSKNGFGEWVFINNNSSQVDIEIQPTTSVSLDYQLISQENTSVVIDGKNISFSLSGALTIFVPVMDESTLR